MPGAIMSLQSFADYEGREEREENHTLTPMAWITLETSNLLTVLSGAEFNALKSAALADSQDDDAVVAEQIETVTNRVRSYVSGNAANTLGPDGTIPQELKHAALVLIRNGVFTRLPALESLNTESRAAEVRSAEAQLKDASNGTLRIAQPETAGTEQVGGSMEVLTTPTRTASRENTRGLM